MTVKIDHRDNIKLCLIYLTPNYCVELGHTCVSDGLKKMLILTEALTSVEKKLLWNIPYFTVYCFEIVLYSKPTWHLSVSLKACWCVCPVYCEQTKKNFWWKSVKLYVTPNWKWVDGKCGEKSSMYVILLTLLLLPIDIITFTRLRSVTELRRKRKRTLTPAHATQTSYHIRI